MGKRVHIGALLIITVLLTIVSGTIGETFQFPEFVAIEGEGDICGGWIIDKTLRPHVLTTEGCVRRGSRPASLRQLLVRYGSAELTSRTSSLAIDRILPDGQYGLNQQLVVLSTFGRVRRNPPMSAPTNQRHNGTAVLCWYRNGEGTLQKTLLQVAPEEKHQLQTLIDTLQCSDAGRYLLEGGLILQNLIPSAMLTVRHRDESSSCGTSVDMLELQDLGQGDTRTMMDVPLVEPAPTSNFTLTEPNSAFGYIVYVIFLGYCLLYTLMFFIFGLMRAHPSTDL